MAKTCMTLLYKWCMLVILMLVLYSNININHAQADSATDFITWDDMNVDFRRYHHHQHHQHHYDFDDYNNHRYVTIRDEKKLERFDDKLNNYRQVDGIRNNNRVIVVDQKGGGDSVTVQGAIDMVPNFNSQRVKIYILPGIYREKVVIPASKPYISLIGEANKTRETVISWGDKASDKTKDGSQLGTFNTASLDVRSDYFCATQITIENSAVWEEGEGSQAVAFKLTGDKAVLYKVRFLGNQDTLLDQTGHHFFYKCFIEGNVDFVFGNAKSLYKECVLHSKATRYGAVAAHHRESLDEDTGFSFTNCTINGSGRIDLGRAWGKYSTTIYSFCFFGDLIHPPGWSDWGNPSKQKTVIFGEYQCWGEGADRRYRVPWSKSLNHNEATSFMDMKFIYGDQWLRL